MEMNITKTKRAGILIITHGSSDLNADLSFSDLLYAELKEKYPEALVCQAYSAPKTLQRIDRDRTRMLFGERHLQKDLMAEKGSLSAMLKEAGHDVTVSPKGLGEYPSIREMFYPKAIF